MKDRISSESINEEFDCVEFNFKMEVLSEFGRRYDEITSQHTDLWLADPEGAVADFSQAAENLTKASQSMLDMDLKTKMEENLAKMRAVASHGVVLCASESSAPL